MMDNYCSHKIWYIVIIYVVTFFCFLVRRFYVLLLNVSCVLIYQTNIEGSIKILCKQHYCVCYTELVLVCSCLMNVGVIMVYRFHRNWGTKSLNTLANLMAIKSSQHKSVNDSISI